jgi:hypothetical protein
MTQKTRIVEDTTTVEPQIIREGEGIAFEVVVAGVTTGITSPTSKWYKENSNTDLSSTYLTGSASVSGVDTIITKTTTSLKAGDWIMSVGGVVDGLTQVVATIPITVKKESER